MEKQQTARNNVLIAFLVLCVCVISVLGGRGNLSAYADTMDDVKTNYEQTNVLDNLKGATLGGKEFDLKDYPHNELGKPQIISLIEFCYSYYADKQSDYGLYVYVYNPQDKPIDMTTDRNKIQLTYGEKGAYEKYKLDFLNYSTEPGYEGRFYKYRISLSDTDKYNFLKELKADARAYKISGFELSVNNKVTEYTVAQSYTYKGFALGYGSELAENDTLSCTVDGFDKYLTLDVRSTFWRPEGTHSDLHSRDTLHSVYFSVPNEIVDEYGEMTGVHATWLNAQTTRMFVTGNKTIYDAFEPYVGEYVTAGDSEDYPGNKQIKYAAVTDSDMSYYGHGHYGTLGYNVFTKGYDGGSGGSLLACYDEIIYYLNYLFYADNGDADSYSLPAELIVGDESKGVKGWFQTYTERFGGELVNDRYSKSLFNHVDDNFTEVHVSATDSYKLSDVTTSKNMWHWLFGWTDEWIVEGENTYDISAIQKVTQADIDGKSKADFCNSFYVDYNDYDDLRNYIKEANVKKETVYLFRYYQSVYDSQEAREFKFIKDWAIARGNFWNYEEMDSNAYFAQMWVQLDFDIIDLTFTKNGVITVIPVVMSPMDIAADADHPVYVDDDQIEWWQILLIVLLIILLLWLLLKFAPGIFTVIIKIVVFPFKVIGMLFSAIGKQLKPLYERNKQRRAENRARRKAEREKEKQDRIEHKERQRQEMIDRKAQEKEQRRQDKIEQKKRKREQKHDMRMRKKAQRNYDEYVKYEEFPWSDKKPKRLLRKEAKELKAQKRKLTLADLDGMSDAELADLYYEEYGDEEFDISDIYDD